MVNKFRLSSTFLFALTCLSFVWCAPSVRAQGSIQGWGTNQNGELGNSNKGTDSDVPVAAGSGVTWTTLSVGGDGHILAIKSDGTVWGWGNNDRGQLGTGAAALAAPTAIAGMPASTLFTAVAAGDGFSVALTSTGTVYAWGNNDLGQLGIGNTTSTTTPTKIASLTGIAAISAGYFHAAALTTGGTIYTWGDNTYGELGNNTNTASNVPVLLSVLNGMTAVTFNRISVSGAGHSLAISTGGAIYAWGYDQDGECGDGQHANNLKVPTKITVANTTFTEISAGESGFSMALDNTGAVWTWGDNTTGELGNGNDTNASAPAKVTGLTKMVQISAGFYHAVAVKADGTVWSWGCDDNGQIGDQGDAAMTPITEDDAPTEAIKTPGATPVFVTGVTMASAGSGCTLVLIPAASPIQSLTLSSASVRGNGSVAVTATVTLKAAVTNLFLTVALSSATTSAATVPATLTINKGATTGTFTVTTIAQATNAGPFNISASFGTTTASTAPLTVTAPTLITFTAQPTTIVKAGSATCTITIDSPAPTAGLDIPLVASGAGSSNVTLPTGNKAHITGGGTSVTFTLATTALSTATSKAVVTATLASPNSGTSKVITLSLMK